MMLRSMVGQISSRGFQTRMVIVVWPKEALQEIFPVEGVKMLIVPSL